MKQKFSHQPFFLLRQVRFLPANIINGITSALGIGLIGLLTHALLPTVAAQWAVSGAVFASLADSPTTPERNWKRVFLAGLSGSLTAFLITYLHAKPVELGFGIALIAALCSLLLAWGPRAGAISFAPVLSIVFTMGHAPTPEDHLIALPLFLWHLLGLALYMVWSLSVLVILQAHFRKLALIAVFQATVRLLRARSRVLDGADSAGQEHDLNDLRRTWVRDEAYLADRLQFARDLLFTARSDDESVRREIAILLRMIELRDSLLTGRLDLEQLGNDPVAQLIRYSLAARLRLLAAQLHLAQQVLGKQESVDVLPCFSINENLQNRSQNESLNINESSKNPSNYFFHSTQPNDHQHQSNQLIVNDDSYLFSAIKLGVDDSRYALLRLLSQRMNHLTKDVWRIQALLCCADFELPLTRKELRLFVAPESWPLNVLRSHATLASPVLRHALRCCVALGLAYAIGLVLPWASHPQWLVLSVSVVLRGNLQQTLSRRNERILGTLLGCFVVMILGQISSQAFLSLAFLISIGVVHSFVVERYLLTAIAATVMALLQVHLLNPAEGFPIVERMADTFLGALMAWAFCFVLPSWERKSLPQTLSRTLLALKNYANQSLNLKVVHNAVAQRLARRQAYDALSALAITLERSCSEPSRVRLPQAELTRFLDYSQRLMSHILLLRLLLLRSDLHQANEENNHSSDLNSQNNNLNIDNLNHLDDNQRCLLILQETHQILIKILDPVYLQKSLENIKNNQNNQNNQNIIDSSQKIADNFENLKNNEVFDGLEAENALFLKQTSRIDWQSLLEYRLKVAQETAQKVMDSAQQVQLTLENRE